MIKDKYNPNPKYTMLTEDDIILREDEYYDYIEDKWIEIDHEYIGEFYNGPYNYEHFLIIRRKNPNYKE